MTLHPLRLCPPSWKIGSFFWAEPSYRQIRGLDGPAKTLMTFGFGYWFTRDICLGLPAGFWFVECRLRDHSFHKRLGISNSQREFLSLNVNRGNWAETGWTHGLHAVEVEFEDIWRYHFLPPTLWGYYCEIIQDEILVSVFLVSHKIGASAWIPWLFILKKRPMGEKKGSETTAQSSVSH